MCPSTRREMPHPGLLHRIEVLGIGAFENGSQHLGGSPTLTKGSYLRSEEQRHVTEG